jgi:hypothetical protein
MRDLTPLVFIDGSFRLSKKRGWTTDVILSQDDVATAVAFARAMTLGDGEHRDHRSGGQIRRKQRQIFHDTLNGKLSEIAVHRWLVQGAVGTRSIGDIDFTTQGLGVWDSGDIEVSGYQFHVKSTKEFGNLLLLEVVDWDENGNYRPNIAKVNATMAGIIFVRLRPDLWKIAEPSHFPDNFSAIEEKILQTEWEFNLVGFATKNDLEQIARDRQILPKNALLQKTTLMDADNYYIQAGDLHAVSRLEDYLQYLEQKKMT